MRLILVPLDGSLFAERALPVALDLSARNHAKIVLVAVHEPALPTAVGHGAMVLDQRYDSGIRDGLARYLDVTAAAIRADDATIDVDVKLLDGSPVPTIDAYALRHGAELIVMTSHGRGGPARWMMGSVADGLARRLHTPVLIVRVDEHAAESVHMPFQRVLIALDGTEESESAITAAVSTVRNDRARFTLLYVSPPLHPLLRAMANPEELTVDIAEQQAAARAYLADAAKRASALGPMETAITVDMHPAAGIVDYATDNRMDLIVLSTHGRGPIGRTLLGSVADKVVRTAQIPVLLCYAPRPE
jgi:nucleotide-binding universal stress UspA family protein